ncbi:hypothetical protein QWU11_28670 [Actinomadura sp. DC4]|nr:hypothetical protein [Actinomadura sp. DC4]
MRALHPVLALALLLAIVFSSPLGGTPAQIRQGALNAVADLAALIFPICAWAARGLLDTEPDAQRHVSAVAAGRWRALLAGSAAAYVFSAVLALAAPIYPLAEAAGSGLTFQVVALSVALLPLSALAATALGALTSRAVMPSPGSSILVLLGVCAANLILGLTPLRFLAVPMIEWMRAAGHGPTDFADAFPLIAARTLAWAAVAGALYTWLRRTRP